MAVFLSGGLTAGCDARSFEQWAFFISKLGGRFDGGSLARSGSAAGSGFTAAMGPRSRHLYQRRRVRWEVDLPKSGLRKNAVSNRRGIDRSG